MRDQAGDRTELTRRERMQLSRVDMPERAPTDRARDFDEVNLGLTPELAAVEAERCLHCPTPRCVEGCPVDVQINDFISALADRDVGEAARILFTDNSLPAMCGRVCPQESQCEAACVLDKKGKPIAIGHLERFVADYAREHRLIEHASCGPASGYSVAVVGSGPAGLACAGDLARMGHAVTVYEALHEPGGVLAYGIPEFRLPKGVLGQEIEQLEQLGVEFEVNAPIGLAESLDELLTVHQAAFLGLGAGLPRFLDVPGENLVGVYSANEFLTRVNLMRAHDPAAETPVFDLRGRRAAVFGGGNTAMDAVRTALRLGAAEATIYYRRTADEMPARAEEVAHAREEGVQLHFLTAPIELLGDDEGWLRGVRLQCMELGEPDADGRRRPVPIEGSAHDVEADIVIVAVGNRPNPLVARTAPDLELTAWGTIEADPDTGETSKPGVFAGGDIVSGGATVILAMGAGRRAASAIDVYLRKSERVQAITGS